MNWVEIYYLLQIIGIVLSLIVIVAVVIFMIVTKRKPW